MENNNDIKSIDIEERLNPSLTNATVNIVTYTFRMKYGKKYFEKFLTTPHYMSSSHKLRNYWNKTINLIRTKQTNIMELAQTLEKSDNIKKSVLFETLSMLLQIIPAIAVNIEVLDPIIIEINKDTLKTLNLYNDQNGYNNAAGLLADENHFPGIDIMKFGENISIIQRRATFENISILEVYDKTIDIFRDYYQYEVIEGADRKKVEKIPEAAFREAVANALIHRAWDIEARIRILMFDDRIEIVSPGGLPSGITEEEYLAGKLSVLRNRNLANVFYRLGFVEIFGTGVMRIKQLYEDGFSKPDFEVSENSIKIVLPNFEKDVDLTEDERIVYKILSKNLMKSISEIAPYIPFGKSKTTQLLKSMGQKGIITVEGRGRGTKYIIR